MLETTVQGESSAVFVVSQQRMEGVLLSQTGTTGNRVTARIQGVTNHHTFNMSWQIFLWCDKQQNNKQPGTEDANRNVELNQTYFVSSLATDLTYLSLEYRITLVTCSTADKDTSQRNHP